MATPEGWRWVKLTDIARLESGHTPSRSQPEYWGGDVPWIGIRDARAHHGGLIHQTLQTVTEEGLANSAARLLPAGTVCLSRTASVGYVTVMGRPMATSQDFVNWVCSDAIEPKFLMHLILAEGDHILKFGKGSTHTTIYFPEVQAFHVCIPSKKTQRRIVSKIESLTTRSRRAKVALDAVPDLLEQFRQSVLAAAFRGDLTAAWREKNPDVEPAAVLLQRIRAERRRRWEEAELAKMRAKGKVPGDDRWKAKYEEPEPVDTSELPELPEGWAWASVGELAWDAGYGTSEKCDYDGQGPPVLRIPNIAKGSLDLSDIKRALGGVAGAEPLAPGDLLIVRTNGSKDLIGRAAVVPRQFNEPHLFASYLIRFRLLGDATLWTWVGSIWESPVVRNAIERMAATSAGQYNVSLSNLVRLPLPIPPHAEQVVAARQAQSNLATIMSVHGEVGAALDAVDSLIRSILSKAFRGELVPQDPTDEPASVLLERLRTEAADPNGKKPKGGKRRGTEGRKGTAASVE